MALIDDIKQLVINGHINSSSKYPLEFAGKPGVEELVQEAIQKNIPADEILKLGLVAGMDVVGDKFSQGEYFVPEMMFSAKAMKAGVALLKPLLVDEDAHTVGKVILGTVQGDMHDIGKNLVAMMLEGAGFKVIDLGVNIAPEVFLKAAKENPQALVGMSALLTVTMQKMREVVAKLRGDPTDHLVLGQFGVRRTSAGFGCFKAQAAVSASLFAILEAGDGVVDGIDRAKVIEFALHVGNAPNGEGEVDASSGISVRHWITVLRVRLVGLQPVGNSRLPARESCE